MYEKKDNQIVTERLIFRLFTDSDLESYYDILKKENVSRYLGTGKKIEKDRVKAAISRYKTNWNDNGYGIWAVMLKDNTLIGHCGLNYLEETHKIELLYAFDPTYWGNGYATEACKATITFAKDNLNVDELIGIVYPNNTGSYKVLEKVGFERKGTEEHFGVELLYYELNIR